MLGHRGADIGRKATGAEKFLRHYIVIEDLDLALELLYGSNALLLVNLT